MGVFDPNFKLKASNNLLKSTDDNKREPVPQSLKRQIFEEQNGKCAKCPIDFNKEELTPHFHHINMNTTDNRRTNIQALCPNCHTKTHKTLKKKRVQIKALGVVIGSRMKVIGKEKKPRTKNNKPKKKKKRKSNSLSLFSNAPKLFP